MMSVLFCVVELKTLLSDIGVSSTCGLFVLVILTCSFISFLNKLCLCVIESLWDVASTVLI